MIESRRDDVRSNFVKVYTPTSAHKNLGEGGERPRRGRMRGEEEACGSKAA